MTSAGLSSCRSRSPRGCAPRCGLRLYTETETLGGLNMYSTSSDTIDPAAMHMAELFAAHASLTLGHARREEQLSTALVTRKVIGQAIGILMERHALDEDGAFAYLTRVSSHTNVKLRSVAQEIVASATIYPNCWGNKTSRCSDAVRTRTASRLRSPLLDDQSLRTTIDLPRAAASRRIRVPVDRFGHAMPNVSPHRDPRGRSETSVVKPASR